MSSSTKGTEGCPLVETKVDPPTLVVTYLRPLLCMPCGVPSAAQLFPCEQRTAVQFQKECLYRCPLIIILLLSGFAPFVLHLLFPLYYLFAFSAVEWNWYLLLLSAVWKEFILTWLRDRKMSEWICMQRRWTFVRNVLGWTAVGLDHSNWSARWELLLERKRPKLQILLQCLYFGMYIS